ncbi:hypothetical protein GCM10020370_30260 [Paenibacillus hodogayensis]
MQSLFGYAKATLWNIEVEDAAIATLQFRNGAVGVIEATTTAYQVPDRHVITIYAEKGTVTLTGDAITDFNLADKSIELPEFGPFFISDGHEAQIRDMVYAIREGRDPGIPGEETVHALEIILGTYESSRLGQQIVFDQPDAAANR